MRKVKEIMCKDCDGAGEIIDKTDEWCGTQIVKCQTCNGEGMIETYKGMQIMSEDISYDT